MHSFCQQLSHSLLPSMLAYHQVFNMHKAAWHDDGHRRRRVYITMHHANDGLLALRYEDGRLLVCQERGKPLAGERRSLPRAKKEGKRLSMDTSQLII